MTKRRVTFASGRRGHVRKPDTHRPLRRILRLPVWGDISLRLLLVTILIGSVVLIHWWDRAGLRDNYDGEISFLDVVYFTLISITTTGFGDIHPISDRARLVEGAIVTPIRILVLFIFIGTAYTYVIQRGWEKWRMARIQAKLSGHIVVLGYGVSGSEAVAELIARGTDPHCIVVMDTDAERLSAAEAIGCNVIEADATRDEHLLDVRIDQARAVLVSAGRDDASILIVLTVQHLAPGVPISVVIRAADNELLARQAGADNVINPVRFTGLLLAGSAQGAHIADYLSDLASIDGEVQLVERTVNAEDAGKRLAELPDDRIALRVYRDGVAIPLQDTAQTVLREGDCVVEIVPTPPR
ncbi:potassium channel family protein [Qipengyuania sediminis]|uniref:potassium channel family protein n=1 Tax=Qipengyuania sediminis TaxID=1532023 RepID=UPI00105AABA0|nr:potassium channel family protein [Qipengyuania sediminis]